MRQHYIRRRLLNTYKALERLSQSEFNLDKLEIEAAASTKTSGAEATSSAVSSRTDSSARRTASNRLSVPGATTSKQQWKNSATGTAASHLGKPLLLAVDEKLTINDVERERGQPLSKYDRNIMIFDWLCTLEPDVNTTVSN